MNPNQLALGIIEYVVFLLSTTCHEAAHALVAKWGGDLTASEGGQVSLNPLPHLRREPFGMILMPLLGILSGTGVIGWASAPYNPLWSQRYPKRAAWMSLAGPAANFSLALIAMILMRIGLMVGIFAPAAPSYFQIVSAPSGSGITEGIATVLSLFFSLNILLGAFNLLPVPPLDGYSVLGLFTSERMALRLQQWRLQMGGLAIIGLLLGWRLFGVVYGPLFESGIRLLYLFYPLS
jgi:Zn-dependent protease